MSKNKKFPKMFGIVAVLVLCVCALGSIALSDSDDASADSTNETYSTPQGTVGTSYSYVLEVDVLFVSKSGTMPPGLSVADSASGVKISGTPTTAGTYTYTVTMYNEGDDLTIVATVTTVIVSSETTLDFTSPDAVDCVSGSSVSYTPTVNVSSSTFTKTSGASWLTLSSGVLSGTAPTVSSMTAYTAVIKATSPGGQTVSQTVTFNVYPVMQLSSSSLSLSCTVDSALSSITITSNISMDSISVTAPTSGFSVTESTSTTATFSGTPTATGTYSFVFTAISSAGPSQTAYITVSLTVTEKTLSITSSYPTDIFVEGTSYSYTPTANQTVTWTISDDLSWLAVSSGSVVGSINGIESDQTTVTYTLTATTSGGQIATQTVVINVEDVLAFTSVPTASCVVIPVYSYNDDGSYFTAIIDNMIYSVDASDGSLQTATFMFVFVGENAEVVTWDFGDGTTAEGFNVTHTYSESGTYTYTCTATNDLGSDSVTGDVTAYVDKTTDYLLYALIGIVVLLVLYAIVKTKRSKH